jgi:hypothetical protein
VATTTMRQFKLPIPPRVRGRISNGIPNENLPLLKQTFADALSARIRAEGDLGTTPHGRKPAHGPECYISGYSAGVVGKDFPFMEEANFLTKPFPAQKLVKPSATVWMRCSDLYKGRLNS